MINRVKKVDVLNLIRQSIVKVGYQLIIIRKKLTNLLQERIVWTGKAYEQE